MLVMVFLKSSLSCAQSAFIWARCFRKSSFSFRDEFGLPRSRSDLLLIDLFDEVLSYRGRFWTFVVDFEDLSTSKVVFLEVDL